ncbi:hypothetical protein [Streptomyces sp. NPDC046887]|uniref:hypothetical protein n=1 Tax=Streptomyces sp. NPDC046887 TaxID=3155472 RepID=UPI0034087ED6
MKSVLAALAPDRAAGAAVPVARARSAARQAATSAERSASGSETGAVVVPDGTVGAVTGLPGVVHGVVASGNSGFGPGAAYAGAPATTSDTAVIAAVRP